MRRYEMRQRRAQERRERFRTAVAFIWIVGFVVTLLSLYVYY